MFNRIYLKKSPYFFLLCSSRPPLSLSTVYITTTYMSLSIATTQNLLTSLVLGKLEVPKLWLVLLFKEIFFMKNKFRISKKHQKMKTEIIFLAKSFYRENFPL